MKPCICLSLILSLLLAIAPSAISEISQDTASPANPANMGAQGGASQQTFPSCGQSKGDNVNIRSGPNLNFEVISQLTKKQPVTVVGEKQGWYEIILPPGASCYVKRDFVEVSDKGAVIKTDDVNIRAGANLNYTSLMQLNKGARVTILGEANGWYRIKPPQGTHGWVKSEFIEYPSAAKEYTCRENREKFANRVFEKIENARESEIQKPMLEQNLAPLLKKYERFIANYPHSNVIEAARLRIAQIKMKLEEMKGRLANLAKSKEKIVQTETGFLEDLGKIYKRPGTHKLVKKDKSTYYLVSNEINLNRYDRRYVTVTGEIQYLPDWPHPLIKVTRIEPTSN